MLIARMFILVMNLCFLTAIFNCTGLYARFFFVGFLFDQVKQELNFQNNMLQF